MQSCSMWVLSFPTVPPTICSLWKLCPNDFQTSGQIFVELCWTPEVGKEQQSIWGARVFGGCFRILKVFRWLSLIQTCNSCCLCSEDYFWSEPLLTLAWCNLFSHYRVNYMLAFHTYHVLYLPEENTVFSTKMI